MRYSKTKKDLGSAVKEKAQENGAKRNDNQRGIAKPKLLKFGNENITCQVESRDIEGVSEANITLSGQLIINYLSHVLDPISSAVNQHGRIAINLKDDTELDLSCLQLLRTIQVTCQSQDIPFVLTEELSKSQKALISNAGFSTLFGHQAKADG